MLREALRLYCRDLSPRDSLKLQKKKRFRMTSKQVFFAVLGDDDARMR